MLLSVAIAASVGAALASVPSVNATVNSYFYCLLQAVPLTSFTKSRPLDNSSWILYTYPAYPVVSGIAPFTVYVTT